MLVLKRHISTTSNQTMIIIEKNILTKKTTPKTIHTTPDYCLNGNDDNVNSQTKEVLVLD